MTTTPATYSTTEAARLLGLTPQTVRTRCLNGKLEHTTDEHGCFRIPVGAVKANAKLQRVTPLEIKQRLITIAEGAKVLGVSKSDMERLIQNRRIPYLPDPFRLDIRDVERFIESSKVPALNAAKIPGSI